MIFFQVVVDNIEKPGSYIQKMDFSRGKVRFSSSISTSTTNKKKWYIIREFRNLRSKVHNVTFYSLAKEEKDNVFGCEFYFHNDFLTT